MSDILKSNLLSTDAINGGIAAVFSNLKELLERHCGPYANYALMDRTTSQGLPWKEFTKDGISIVRETRFTHPDSFITEHFANSLRDTVAHIGQHVDEASHDGTTTAMLLYCILAQRLRGHRSSPDGQKILPKAYEAMIGKGVLEALRSRITTDTITVARLMADWDITELQARKFMAFNQSLIASKGDVAMADAITECITYLPDEIKAEQVIRRSPIETAEHVSAVTQPEDFLFFGGLGSYNHRNWHLNTALRMEDAHLYVTENDLVDNSPETEGLVEYLQSHVREGRALEKNLVILNPGHVSSLIINAVTEYNNSVGEDATKATWLHVSTLDSGQTVNFVKAIRLTGGSWQHRKHAAASPEIGVANMFISGVTVYWDQNQIGISNLYTKDPNKLYHPFYKSEEPEHVAYNTMVEDMRTYLRRADDGHVRTAETMKTIEDYTNILRQMMCQKIVDVRVSGAIYDHIATLSVARDAYGAAHVAMTDGVVVGGWTRILNELVLLVAVLETEDLQKPAMSAWHKVASHFMHAVVEVLDITYMPGQYRYPRTVAEGEQSHYYPLDLITRYTINYSHYAASGASPYVYLKLHLPNKETSNSSRPYPPAHVALYRNVDVAEEKADMVANPALLQPAAGFHALFRRLNEVLTKISVMETYVDRASP